MKPLPIDALMPEILAALERSGAAVVVAEPGAGKTTRVPPAILRRLEDRDGTILMLEPRRVAARAAARRIAEELGENLGDRVGYQVRFDRVGGKSTRLWVLTEGILGRRMQDDPFLDGVDVVILDEFHERSLHADLALALLADLKKSVRPELGIVVMSATIDPVPVSEYLGGAPIIRAPGRTYPVAVEYMDRLDTRPIPELAARAVDGIVGSVRGDILVFLPGAGEISRTAELLDSLSRTASLDIVPLHGDLPPEAQDRALSPGPMKKVILATNVAETSLTIEGVSTVVDTGWVKEVRHDPRLGIDRLELKRISRASADQRAGRAGRTGPGRALRLWTRAQDAGLEPFAVPEIRRVDLAQTVLELAAWGITDPLRFGWFEAPGAAELERARTLLLLLGLLDKKTNAPTETGRAVLKLPLHPRLGRMMVEAHHRGVVEGAALLASLVAEKDIVLGARAFGKAGPMAVGPSDLLHRLDLFREAERGGFRGHIVSSLELDQRALRSVQRSAKELVRTTRSALGPDRGHEESDDELLKTILAGFPDRVARRREAHSPRALMVGNRGLTLSERSVVKEDEFFVAVLVEGGRSKTADSQVRLASRIDPKWLGELFPGSLEKVRHGRFDDQTEKILGWEDTHFFDLVIAQRTGLDVDFEIASEALKDAVRKNPSAALPDDEGFKTFCLRWRMLREACPELEFPPLEEADLVEAVCDMCDGRKKSLRELRQGPILEILKGRLGWKKQKILEDEMPERFDLPNGRSARIRYEIGRPPVIAARVQHLFGVLETPKVARGKIACLIELLAPNQRPVQVTADLRGFWSGTYQLVRKDLRGRYPKHDWPERPPGV